MSDMVIELCGNCNNRPARKHRRGLCHSCYRRIDVRMRHGTRCYEKPDAKQLPLPEPCCHQPGSEGKIQALAERVRLKQELWHPQDAKLKRMEVA